MAGTQRDASGIAAPPALRDGGNPGFAALALPGRRGGEPARKIHSNYKTACPRKHFLLTAGYRLRERLFNEVVK
jgi:hypothetical protein